MGARPADNAGEVLTSTDGDGNITKRTADGLTVLDSFKIPTSGKSSEDMAWDSKRQRLIRGRAVGAYFEAHIEQGPILEDTRNVIGVVVGALGLRWYDCIWTGQDAHAGPTPMEARRDALRGASRMVEAIHALAVRHALPMASQAREVAHIQVLRAALTNSCNLIGDRTSGQHSSSEEDYFLRGSFSPAGTP